MVAADVQRTVDDKFLSALTAEVNSIGQTRFVRFKNEVFTAAFVDHAKALDAVNVGLVRVRNKNLIHKFAIDHGVGAVIHPHVPEHRSQCVTVTHR